MGEGTIVSRRKKGTMDGIFPSYTACIRLMTRDLPALLFALTIALLLPVRGHANPQAETGSASPNFEFSSPPKVAPTSFSTPARPRATEPVKVSPPTPKPLLNAPKGFQVSIFASGLAKPRDIAVSPSGDVFVSQIGTGNILLLRDRDGDGTADLQEIFADGFRQPSGLAIRAGALYVADMRAIWRLPYKTGESRAGQRLMVTRPGALGTQTSRPSHGIAFAPDGKHFYISIGSESDIAEESLPHASIQQFQLDGSAQATYASGLRYSTALAFNPDTKHLYAVVNERDSLTANPVPDFFTRVRKSAFYGWPYAYNGRTPDPQFGDLRPDLVRASLAPDLLFPAHASPTGLLFYQGAALPDKYRGDAFIVLHGSRDTSKPVGYKVVRVAFKKGKPKSDYEDFLTGFLRMERGRAEISGRPYAIAEAKDGSLLISDDVAGVIWRVEWKGRQAGPGVISQSLSPQ
jgi:glucose/arabinose dehydrogenase